MKTIRNLSIAAKIGVAFARVIAVFAVSAGVCIFSVRALDAKQKEIVTSEQTQLPLKGGTADYLNIRLEICKNKIVKFLKVTNWRWIFWEVFLNKKT
ncbi:hypothetical protein [Burkholderia pseudomallei]|uniref:hypothetical protein n=1 Tax=Burkholderia pseudomallei TaxID=28450 RepID=UPI000A76C242|nr:hypothetical protein [Burkholderia pseudomallei]